VDGGSVRGYGGPHLRGRAVAADVIAVPFFAYPFLVATLLGWIWTLLKNEA
jgi:hypothetical protein